MNEKKKIIISFLVLITVTILIFVTIQDNKVEQATIPESKIEQSQKGDISSEELVDSVFDVLGALDNFYFASIDNMIGDVDKITWMTELLNDTKLMQLGVDRVKSYVGHDNEIINLTTKGMIVGAVVVMEANNKLLEDLKNNSLTTEGDLLDLEYSTAVFLSSQKEGFKLITISAPQITSLIFRPASSENPTGEIPYTISKSERNKIINEIDRLFLDNINKDKLNFETTNTHNSIIFSVEAIKNNIIYDTYEEINTAEKQGIEKQIVTNKIIPENNNKEESKKAFDWTIPDSIIPVMNDTLNTYKDGYTSIEKTINGEKEIQKNIYELLVNTTNSSYREYLLQFLEYSKEYTDSGATLLVWLDTSAKYYQRLITAINNRDEQQYIINSGLIKEQESQKDEIMNDFTNKEKIKQNFAASTL